jgi:hypothetical protein
MTNTKAAHRAHSPDTSPPAAPAVSLPAISLAVAVRELFGLAERIQRVKGCDAMRAFYEARSLRPDLYDRVAAAPPEEVNEILERSEREKEEERRNDADAA